MISDRQGKPESRLQRNRREVYEQPYGNLGKLNTCRLLLDTIGEDLLFEIVSNFVDLLDTSIAVYEKNGDYALGIFASGWCRLLDHASRNLCAPDDNAAALRSGAWLCHESCWISAKLSMEKDQPVDIECHGGIHLFAVPIHARGEVVGSINLGYGNPPRARGKIKKIADKYGLSVDSLIEQAKPHRVQSALTIDIAKRCLLISARLISEIVECRLMEAGLMESESRYREIASGIPGIVFQLLQQKDGSISLPFINESFYDLCGLRAEEQGDPVMQGNPVMQEAPTPMTVETNPSRLLDLIAPQDRDFVKKALIRSAQAVETCKTEFRIRVKTGEIKRVHVVAYPHALSDGSILWNGVALDGHDRKQAKEIGQVAGASTAGPVHDFNNLLATIMGYTELTLDETSKENPARPYLLEMLNSIHRAKDLFRQVHAYVTGTGDHGCAGDTCAIDETCGTKDRQAPEDQRHCRDGKEKEPVQPKIDQSGSLPRGEENILLVDDEESVAYVEEQMLSYLGYKVFPIRSSLEALDTFRAEPNRFDLVILDQVMPNMNGTELAREIMVIRPDIPIIMCTGYHEGATLPMIKTLGIRNLLLKPIDMYQIAQTIRSVLAESGMKPNHG